MLQSSLLSGLAEAAKQQVGWLCGMQGNKMQEWLKIQCLLYSFWGIPLVCLSKKHNL